jgi:hypothetical protein
MDLSAAPRGRHRARMLRCKLLWLGALALMACASPGAATNRPAAPAAAAPGGEHDFDFELGTWKTHLTRLQHPLTGSTTWITYEGTSVIRKVWGGRANLVELEVDGPTGHLEGLSLRLYNPDARQWSLNYANAAGGTIGTPTVGSFHDGRGELYDQEKLGDRMILVRNVFSDITADSYRFEQAFSDDGGKTWEVNWIAVDTRIADAR